MEHFHIIHRIIWRNGLKENVDSSFSLTLRNETTAQGYIDQYREAMTANGGTVTYEKSYFVIQPQISFSIIEQSTGYVKFLSADVEIRLLTEA